MTTPTTIPTAKDIRRAAALLADASYCIALTGAGISAESGIPTFRGKDGLWTKHGEPPLNQIDEFRDSPADWWRMSPSGGATPTS